MIFPAPHSIGLRSTRWRLSEILAYEAAQVGESAPALSPADERYLRDVEVAERLGVSRNTVWRWTKEAQEAAHA